MRATHRSAAASPSLDLSQTAGSNDGGREGLIYLERRQKTSPLLSLLSHLSFTHFFAMLRQQMALRLARHGAGIAPLGLNVP